MTWSVFLGYIVLKVFDILIYVVSLREKFSESDTIAMFKLVQSGFNTFVFQPLKIFLVIYFWFMA